MTDVGTIIAALQNEYPVPAIDPVSHGSGLTLSSRR